MSASADFQKGLTALQSGDFATALRKFKSLAEQKDARSQSNLGFLYSTGKGFIQDCSPSATMGSVEVIA